MALTKCIITSWFGTFPEFFDIWLKTCEQNRGFSFFVFTDADIQGKSFPPNVTIIPFTINQFIDRAQRLTSKKINFKRVHRICDFRPAFGLIFKEEIKDYDFWGHCDQDLVFGNLEEFIPETMLLENDLVLNGGHLSLYRNNDEINTLFLKKGAAFDFETVASHDAIFCFDEITGIRRIAQNNGIRYKWLLPYVESEIRYHQLRSRLDRTNPNNQAYYWEKGELYRVKIEAGDLLYQKLAYMHLQKRPLKIDLRSGNIGDAFWIIPTGVENKKNLGKPLLDDVIRTNPYEGETTLHQQSKEYMRKKIKEMLHKSPYQLYVRIIQEKYGINHDQCTLEERPWEKY